MDGGYDSRAVRVGVGRDKLQERKQGEEKTKAMRGSWDMSGGMEVYQLVGFTA